MLGFMLTFVGYALAAAAGAVATVAAQWYLFNRWISNQPSVSPDTKPTFGVFQLPEVLAKTLQSGGIGSPENCVALNLILQFLYRELRYSPHVRRWLHKKLSAEFAELLTRTTTGKLFDNVVVREVHLGSALPVINSITVKEARVDSQLGHLEKIDLNLDLIYSGGFQLAVDANMLLGKAASLAVTVTHLSGQARLQFQRNPYTHWSFSFYSEPHLELAVESHFQGRPLPQVTSLIINQIRKTVKKKHTLPNYKLRYKPFFHKPGLGEEDDEVIGRDVPSGTLKVSVLEITRLNLPNPPPAFIYCSLAVDTTAWVEVVQRADSGSWLTVDVTVARGSASTPGDLGSSGPPLGIVFKQHFVAARYQPCVLVESVTARSPAAAAGVQRGDLLLAIDGRRVASLAQAARLLRSGSADRCTLRLERRAVVRGHTAPPSPGAAAAAGSTSPGPMLSAAQPSEDSATPAPSESEASPTATPTHEIKDSETRLGAPESPVLRRRKLSSDPSNGVSLQAGSDTDSGSSSPPSAPESPAKRPSGAGPSTEDHRNSEEIDSLDGLQLQRTQELPCNLILNFEETLQFEVMPHHRYLNVSVWGRSRETINRGSPAASTSPVACLSVPTSDQLLGHVSLTLSPIISECQVQGPLSHQLRPCVLLPPDPHAALSYSHPLTSHSGFEPCLCYGDILMAFLFTPHEAGMIPSLPSNNAQRTSRPASPREPTVASGFTSGVGLRRHDFLRTHFNRATQCEFCGKKIWLKDAVQCRDCSMTCHKKCVAKCQEAASCIGYDSSGALRRPSAQPEIVTTAADEETLPIPSQQQGGPAGGGGDGQRRGGLGGLLATAAAHARGLKRAGSANNLALPGGSTSAGASPATPSPGLPPSRSLPPSPQRSPQPSRKSSLASTPPFSLSGEEDVEVALERLLAHPNDDDLMAAAKTSGKNLYACLPLPERKQRINNMITKLKAAMDTETRARMALEGVSDTGLGGRSGPTDAARNAFLIGKSDEKVQALAVLMLHFCAGLQHAQDLEDAAKRDAEGSAYDETITQEAVQ